MSIPYKSDVSTMDWALNGGPAVFVSGNNTIDTQTMDWAFNGGPFVGQPNNPTPASGSNVMIMFIGL